jgi:enoyl-CoA hydratase
MTHASELIRYHAQGRVGYVVLNRAEKLNAITESMKHLLIERFREADADPATSVIVLRAEGRSFCAGHDIGGGDDDDHESDARDALAWYRHLDGSVKSEMAPWEVSKPVIASVQGHVLGGGCQLMLFCDLVIASESARFGEPEVRFSNTGPAFVMPWIIGWRRARELIYFGDQIDAQTALSYGMVNRIVPDEELADATRRYAERLALIAPEALAATKRALRRGAEADGFRNAIHAGHDVVSALYAAETEFGKQFFEIASRDGLKAALNWRSGQFRA